MREDQSLRFTADVRGCGDSPILVPLVKTKDPPMPCPLLKIEPTFAHLPAECGSYLQWGELCNQDRVASRRTAEGTNRLCAGLGEVIAPHECGRIKEEKSHYRRSSMTA